MLDTGPNFYTSLCEVRVILTSLIVKCLSHVFLENCIAFIPRCINVDAYTDVSPGPEEPRYALPLQTV